MALSQSLARFNRSVTNHVTGPFAAWLPGFGVVTHNGRKSGREYRVPVNVFRRDGGFTFALTYGQGDWVKNVMHAGTAQLRTRGRTHTITNPRIVDEPDHPSLPWLVRKILRRVDVTQELLADDTGEGSRSA